MRDVVPMLRTRGFGMDEESLARVGRERQLGEEIFLRRVQLVAGPVACLARIGIHGVARPRDGSVMIALDDEGVLIAHVSDEIHHIARIGAIADEIAEKDETLGAARPGISQASIKRFTVGMDVRENGEKRQNSEPCALFFLASMIFVSRA